MFPLPSWEGTKGRGSVFAVCKFLMDLNMEEAKR